MVDLPILFNFLRRIAAAVSKDRPDIVRKSQVLDRIIVPTLPLPRRNSSSAVYVKARVNRSVHRWPGDLLDSLNKVHAGSCFNYATHFTRLQSKRSVLELFLHLAFTEQTQISSLTGAATVGFGNGEVS